MDVSEQKKSNKFVEIEYKYRGGSICWEEFVSNAKKLNPIKRLVGYGPDTYYKHSDGKILRWRHNETFDELTFKHRTSEKSSLVREEVDLVLGDNSLKGIIKFITFMCFKKLFRVYKDYYVLWYRTDDGIVLSASIYDVYHKDRIKRRFAEVEIEKGQMVRMSRCKEVIREWEQKLGLKPSQRINSTLLEIYSDEQTALIDNLMLL